MNLKNPPSPPDALPFLKYSSQSATAAIFFPQ